MSDSVIWVSRRRIQQRFRINFVNTKILFNFYIPTSTKREFIMSETSSSAQDRKLANWYTRIKNGSIKLPRFQRMEAWDRHRIESFLKTYIQAPSVFGSESAVIIEMSVLPLSVPSNKTFRPRMRTSSGLSLTIGHLRTLLLTRRGSH